MMTNASNNLEFRQDSSHSRKHLKGSKIVAPGQCNFNFHASEKPKTPTTTKKNAPVNRTPLSILSSKTNDINSYQSTVHSSVTPKSAAVKKSLKFTQTPKVPVYQESKITPPGAVYHKKISSSAKKVPFESKFDHEDEQDLGASFVQKNEELKRLKLQLDKQSEEVQCLKLELDKQKSAKEFFENDQLKTEQEYLEYLQQFKIMSERYLEQTKILATLKNEHVSLQQAHEELKTITKAQSYQINNHPSLCVYASENNEYKTKNAELVGEIEFYETESAEIQNAQKLNESALKHSESKIDELINKNTKLERENLDLEEKTGKLLNLIEDIVKQISFFLQSFANSRDKKELEDYDFEFAENIESLRGFEEYKDNATVSEIIKLSNSCLNHASERQLKDLGEIDAVYNDLNKQKQQKKELALENKRQKDEIEELKEEIRNMQYASAQYKEEKEREISDLKNQQTDSSSLSSARYVGRSKSTRDSFHYMNLDDY